MAPDVVFVFADYQGGSGSDDSGGSGGESDSDSSSGAESVQEVGHAEDIYAYYIWACDRSEEGCIGRGILARQHGCCSCGV